MANDTLGFIVIDEFNRTLEKRAGFWSDNSLLSEQLVLFDDKTAKINISSDSSKQIFASPANLYWILLRSFSNITDKRSGKSKIARTIPAVTMKVFCGDFLFVTLMSKEQRD